MVDSAHMSSSISSFIAHARSKGMDHQTIRMLLLSAGWKERDISQALASETLDMPVPLPPDARLRQGFGGQAGSARDAFFHLLSFTALVSTVVSMIFLGFDFLNRLLPDPAFPNYYDDVSSVRWELAVLFVSFPLFLWMSRLLQKEYARHQEKLASGVRRWLTYLTLFVTACTLVGDLIALIFSLLQGEVTMRFFFKVIVILVLAGLPFRYYLYSLRIAPERFVGHRLHKRYLSCGIALVLVSVIGALYVTGSPLRGRAERFDEQRVNDLRSIQSEVLNIVYGNQRGMPSATPIKHLPRPLPKTLDEVQQNSVYQKLNLIDPETGLPYEYLHPSDHEFQLCAVFTFPRDQQYDIFWNHPAGQKCFEFDALDSQGK